MKNFDRAHICAYVSLTISVILIALWICNVGGFTVVSLDSFVGIIVALLAIIVAFAVAWNIYNGIDLRNEVKEAKSEFKKEVEKVQTEFDKKVEEVKKVGEKMQEEIAALKKANGHSSHLIFLQFGDTALTSGEYANAIQYYMCSLSIAMQHDSTYNVEFVLNKLEIMISKYAEIEKNESEYRKEGYLYQFDNITIKNIEDYNNRITSSQGFNSIHERYSNMWDYIQDIISRYKL